MSHRIVARVFAVVAVAALVLGLFATPAAAAGHASRWVDDDNVAGDGPDQCDNAGYAAIQAAIDDSAAGDWVYVCPGTYTEQLTIPTGVHVKSRPLHAATIAAPTDGTGNVVELTGNHATLRGFRIEITAQAVAPAVNPTSIGCVEYATAVLVLGNNDGVRNNLISAVGPGTLTGPCGYQYGIVVGAHGDSATARVTFNWVTDFKYGGILVEDTDSYAYVRRNTVRFFHENDCPILAIVCGTTLRPIAGLVNSAFPQSFGIGVESEARANIIRNWVGSGPNACIQLCTSVFATTPALSQGISLIGLDSSETTDVYYNVVERTVGGIVTGDAADGAVIHGNYIYGSHYAYQIGGDNDEWHHNHASGNYLGGTVSPSASGNNIHDNDFRGNSNYDCQDQSSGSGTANTANTWTNDLGNTDSPDGICIPDA